ncbi:MAG: DMT family transporter [Rhodospirillaceae bacterium]
MANPSLRPPVDQQDAPTSRNLALGILCMLIAIGGFATMQMFVKLAGPEYPPFQAVFIRSVIAAVIIVPWMLKSGGTASFKTDCPCGHFFRSLSGVLGNASFFYAYSIIALTEGMAIVMSVPIFVALSAILFLGEKVGVRRWTAILVGFAGVMVALNPAGDFQLGSLFALSGTLCWVFSIIMIKKLTETESPFLIVFYYMMTAVVVSGVIVPFIWVTPTMKHALYFFAAGIAGAIGQVLATYSVKLAPANVVTPFEYTTICWGVVFDLTIWGVLPDLHTAIGAGIVIMTGLYIWHRETRVRAGL